MPGREGSLGLTLHVRWACVGWEGAGWWAWLTLRGGGGGQRQVGVAMLALEDLENQAKELGLDSALDARKLGQGVQAEAGSGGV